MESIDCPLCVDSDDRPLIEEDGFRGRQCLRCGLIFVSPRPSKEEVRDLYGHDEAHITAEEHIAAERAKRLHARHNLKVLKTYVPGGALLELGSGAGFFLDEARKAGFDPVGVEFNPDQAAFIRIRLGLPCEQGDLDSPAFKGRRFDVVYHCDVISHLHDPISEFLKIRGCLEERGLLVFETGNVPDVSDRYFRYYESWQLPDHLFFFGSRNLQVLLERTGFELLAMHRYSILPQLTVRRLLAGVKQRIRSNRPRPKGASSPRRVPVNEEALSTKAIRFGWTYLAHTLRYGVGRLAPKARRPQTVIVVARKKPQGEGSHSAG